MTSTSGSADQRVVATFYRQSAPGVKTRAYSGARDEKASGSSIFDVGRGCGPRAVSTAEDAISNFRSMPDDTALAVLANGRESLDRAFEAVECVELSSRPHFK